MKRASAKLMPVLMPVLLPALLLAVALTGCQQPAPRPEPWVELQTAEQLAPLARTPTELARASCVRLRLAAQGVQADSAATVVQAELAAARVLAAAAVRADGRWAALSGGLGTLELALKADDAEAARVGLETALGACPR